MRTPTYLYRCNSDGTVVAGVFDRKDTLPEGWHESPGEAEDAAKPPKRGPGRPPKRDVE